MQILPVKSADTTRQESEGETENGYFSQHTDLLICVTLGEHPQVVKLKYCSCRESTLLVPNPGQDATACRESSNTTAFLGLADIGCVTKMEQTMSLNSHDAVPSDFIYSSACSAERSRIEPRAPDGAALLLASRCEECPAGSQ